MDARDAGWVDLVNRHHDLQLALVENREELKGKTKFLKDARSLLDGDATYPTNQLSTMDERSNQLLQAELERSKARVVWWQNKVSVEEKDRLLKEEDVEQRLQERREQEEREAENDGFGFGVFD